VGPYLIDGNAVLDYLAGTLPTAGKELMRTVVNRQPRISVITKIEVMGYPTQPLHSKLILEFIDNCLIFPISSEVVDRTIEIRKAYRIKIPDAIIAATALEYELILITRNVRDFEKLGVEVSNPWTVE